jgi:hypothetical protein
MDLSGLQLELDSYSVNELHQLKMVTLQSIEHYNKVKTQYDFEKMKEGDRMAFDMCMGQARAELELIEAEIKKRAGASPAKNDGR